MTSVSSMDDLLPHSDHPGYKTWHILCCRASLTIQGKRNRDIYSILLPHAMILSIYKIILVYRPAVKIVGSEQPGSSRCGPLLHERSTT